METLPSQIISFLGEFLDLREIGRLSRTNKKINQKMKDTVFFHYAKKRMMATQKLPEEFKTWREFVKETTELKWGKYLEGKVKLSNENKRISVQSVTDWTCAITNLSFSRGIHFVVFKIHHFYLNFLGVAFGDVPLKGPASGKKSFSYSPAYSDLR